MEYTNYFRLWFISLNAAYILIILPNKIELMEQQEENQKNNDKTDGIKAEKQALNSYVKYTGVAFQMMAIIGLSAYIGYKTDQYYEHKTQWVTAIVCVLGVFLSIYQTIRQLKPWALVVFSFILFCLQFSWPLLPLYFSSFILKWIFWFQNSGPCSGYLKF